MNYQTEKVPTLEEYIRSRPAASSNPRKRIQMLAKELAWGVYNKYWDMKIEVYEDDDCANSVIPRDDNLKLYFDKRWKIEDIQHEWNLLEAHEHLVHQNRFFGKLTDSALALVHETEPYNVFVSYKRSESSALALLCVCRLKANDLVPFIDMALEAGGNWHADLEEHIKACDYFIILLGKDTLESCMTVDEVKWALQYERTIIPIWHSGFDSSDDRWSKIDKKVMDTIQRTNAIIVQKESAADYNTAIVELLNRFGITP